MNDRSPSGPSAPNDTAYHASYPGHASFDTGYGTTGAPSYGADPGYPAATATSYVDDPLFGAMPGQEQPAAATATYEPVNAAYGNDFGGHTTTGYDNGGYDTGSYPGGGYDTGSVPAYDTGTLPTTGYTGGGYDTGSHDLTGYDTGSHDSGQWAGAGRPTGATIPAQPDHHWAADATTTSGEWQQYDGPAGQGTAGGGYDAYADPYAGGGWDSGTYPVVDPADPLGSYETYPSYEAQGTYEGGYGSQGAYDTGAYEALGTTTSGTGGLVGQAAAPPVDAEAAGVDADADTEVAPDEYGSGYDTGEFDAVAEDTYDDAALLLDDAPLPDPDETVGSGGGMVTPLPVGGGRAGRRRAAKPKRSVLLTVAVPSVAVMGVAGIAAASVGGIGEDGEKTAQAAPDAAPVKPSTANAKLDTQLDGVRADAGAFAGRASRTQERIDLKERQEAERKRKEAEAARKEALRPKFAVPVDQPGLSAYYGQAGINWMSLHTGIDFPVSYGTPVKAATDGVITVKSDYAYGTMIVLTAADGTETWYCHLSSTRFRGGEVKAGETIGYSGNSGNSTGPHLHFEVRPGGGSAVDPVAWFRGKGLDPT